jgi:hypothetical protein
MIENSLAQMAAAALTDFAREMSGAECDVNKIVVDIVLRRYRHTLQQQTLVWRYNQRIDNFFH